uniref:RNase H domain-containing protein n=2 Tax=Strongyloides venezuelensis TaxID=75913 RepID=A0A0K0FBP9_STRVS
MHPDDKEWINGTTFEKCSPHIYKIVDGKGLVHVRKEHEINFLQRKMKTSDSTYKFSSQKDVIEHLSQKNYECIIASDGSCLKGKGTRFVINHNGTIYAGGRPYFKSVTAQYLEVQNGSCLKGKGTGFVINHNGTIYTGGRPYFKSVTAQYLEVQSIYDCLLVMKSLKILSLNTLWMIDSQYVCMCLRRLVNWKEQEFILCNKRKAKHANIWEKISELFDPSRCNIVKVASHQNIIYNELADKIAKHYSEQEYSKDVRTTYYTFTNMEELQKFLSKGDDGK